MVRNPGPPHPGSKQRSCKPPQLPARNQHLLNLHVIYTLIYGLDCRLSRKAVLCPSWLGLGGRGCCGRAEAGRGLSAEGWLAVCRLSAAKWGKRLLFAVVHNYSQALEMLHMKSIRKRKLWGVSWVLEITEMVSFWVFFRGKRRAFGRPQNFSLWNLTCSHSI